MKLNLTFLFAAAYVLSFAQGITPAQQKALHAYVDYANHSAEEINKISQSFMEYYPSMKQMKGRGVQAFMRYSCPVQPEEYYYNTALQESGKLGAAAGTLRTKLDLLKEAAQKVDAQCKALDTYHKLEDYKLDDFQKAEELVTGLPALLQTYREAQHQLSEAMEMQYRKLQPHVAGNAYHEAAKKMLSIQAAEKALLDRWSFNLEEKIHTGWPVEQLEAGIIKNESELSSMQAETIQLNYPASSSYKSFLQAIRSIISEKRSALDGYNAEARKSDLHSNDTYLDLINYYNGALNASYNSFIDFARQDGYHGLKAVNYVVLVDVRTEEKEIKVTATPFEDIAHAPVSVSSQSKPLALPVAQALNNYIDYINECMRQARLMQMSLESFNSRASYLKGLTSFERRGSLTFNFSDFKVPVSQHQKTVSDSRLVSGAYAKSLNEQAEVLLRILKEMEALSVALEEEVETKRYEKDHLKKVYEILERYQKLFNILDERKELLYNDVRLVYDSYPAASPEASWTVSWKALRSLTDEDHKALFTAKEYYEGSSNVVPETATIEQLLREVLGNEYDNMKGIQKYGRSHGLCPYTPYEDIPQTSRTLGEKLLKVGSAKPVSGRHPYYDLVYLYNDIVDDHNKFCELSGQQFLKTVKQPWIFEVKYPEAVASDRPRQDNGSQQPAPVEGKQDEKGRNENTIGPGVVKVIRDTVYIEKRDTVYLEKPSDGLRSMEGYAVNNMVLLLDVSGSMNAPDKLPLLKQSVLNMLEMMRQDDQIAIVVYSGKAKVLLHSVSFKNEEKIRKVIEGLESSGTTDGNAGIKLALQTADKNYLHGGNNRVIIATDGEFPISETVFDMVKKFARNDISISVFNFGKGHGSSRNLEKLSKVGRGNYEHITPENVELKLIGEAKAKKLRQ